LRTILEVRKEGENGGVGGASRGRPRPYRGYRTPTNPFIDSISFAAS
jgi:hypothetical protein